jgi:hypothetical protein
MDVNRGGGRGGGGRESVVTVLPNPLVICLLIECSSANRAVADATGFLTRAA